MAMDAKYEASIPVKAQRHLRQLEDFAVRARINYCYACGSCIAECPVNRATDRLHPGILVRMAGLGMLEELLRTPEIWHCLSCNRCRHVCPMTVSPAALIGHLRREAVRNGIVTKETERALRGLLRRLQRVRRRVVALCLEGKALPDPALLWQTFAEEPFESSLGATVPLEVPPDAGRAKRSLQAYLGYPLHVSDCFTCSECTNACPVCLETSVFDPQWIFRMINLGFIDALVQSPSIWLCIGCQSCTRACIQGVRGHLVVLRVQQVALARSGIRSEFVHRWGEAQRLIYREFLAKVSEFLSVSCTR